jgi:hypothetical protein
MNKSIHFIVFFGLSLLVVSCSNNQKEKRQDDQDYAERVIGDISEEVQEEPVAEKMNREEKDMQTKDKELFAPFFNELKGIEKFFVKDNVYRLYKLLEFKGEEDLDDIKLYVEKKNSYLMINIIDLDAKNGYIAFDQPETDCRTTMVYWNGPNNVPFIGTSQNCCTMFCEGGLSFEVYGEEIGYEKLVDSVVVPEINTLYNMKPKGHIEGEGFDRSFILPKEGKNILFQLGNEKSIELVWNEGKFLIK